MRDLRDVLDEAAGSPPDLPDIAMIRRRARPVLARRRAATALAVVCATVATGVGVVAVRDELGERGSTVSEPTPDVGSRALRPGQLEPGTYDGRVGPYDLRLTLDTDDWSVIADQEAWLALGFRQYVVHFQVWGSVVPAGSPDARGQEPTPADIVDWLANNDRITTTADGPTEVGGVPGTEVTLRVARPLDRPPTECTTARCVVLARVAGAGELVHVERGERARLLVLGEPGHQVVVTYRAPEDEFTVIDQAARDLFSGLRLTPTG